MISASDDTQKNYAAIRDELLKTGMVNAVNRSFSPITDIWWSAPAPDWDGKPVDGELIVTRMATDIDYAKTMGVKIIEGKDFPFNMQQLMKALINLT
jgi:hypothetical protein